MDEFLVLGGDLFELGVGAVDAEEAFREPEDDLGNAFDLFLSLFVPEVEEHAEEGKEGYEVVVEVLFGGGVATGIKDELDNALLHGMLEEVHHVQARRHCATCQNCVRILYRDLLERLDAGLT